MQSLPRARRIVTAIDEQGRSFIVEDGHGPGEKAFPGTPFRSENIWRTTATPAPVAAPDSIADQNALLPPASGTLLRVIDFPPVAPDAATRHAIAAAVFAAIYPDVAHDAGSTRAAGVHTTNTVDYAIVLAGEIVAVMDKGETLMKTGDILIQRGTAHAWENRSDQMARIAFILIDGAR